MKVSEIQQYINKLNRMRNNAVKLFEFCQALTEFEVVSDVFQDSPNTYSVSHNDIIDALTCGSEIDMSFEGIIENIIKLLDYEIATIENIFKNSEINVGTSICNKLD